MDTLPPLTFASLNWSSVPTDVPGTGQPSPYVDLLPTKLRPRWDPLTAPNPSSPWSTILANSSLLFAGILFISRFGTLRTRRNFVYYTNALAIPFFLLQRQYFWSALLTLGVLHSLAHHLWPFITVAGLNIKATAFPDVVVHMGMHVVVHLELLRLGSTSMGTISASTMMFSWAILVACCWNAYLASYSRVNEPWFVWTSISQALSTGSWVGFLIAAAGMKIDGKGEVEGSNLAAMELVLWGMWALTLANWFVFKSSATMLKRLFRMSYLDTLFVLPVWIFIWRHGGFGWSQAVIAEIMPLVTL